MAHRKGMWQLRKFNLKNEKIKKRKDTGTEKKKKKKKKKNMN